MRQFMILFGVAAAVALAQPTMAQQLAGLELRAVRVDQQQRKLSVTLANTTDKWITAWAWRLDEPSPESQGGVQWTDCYQSVDPPGFTSLTPSCRIRPKEVRETTIPIATNVSSVTLVAVVFEDLSAAGETWVIDRFEKQRQRDVEVWQRFLDTITRIRASGGGIEDLQKEANLRPSTGGGVENRVRVKLLQVMKQIEAGTPANVILPTHETVASSLLERAKAQSHLRRLQ